MNAVDKTVLVVLGSMEIPTPGSDDIEYADAEDGQRERIRDIKGLRSRSDGSIQRVGILGINEEGSESERLTVKKVLQNIFYAPTDSMLSRMRGSDLLKHPENRDQSESKSMIHPFSHFKFFWDCIIIAMLMFTVLALPVGIAFFSDDQMDTAWIAINIIVDIIFLADILVTLRTGRLSKKVPDKVILYPSKVARMYCTSWFFVDLISSVPIDYIVYGIVYLLDSISTDVIELMDEESMVDNLIFIRVTRLLGILKLLRVTKLIRASQTFGTIVFQLFDFAAGRLRILKLVTVMVVLTHWNGCLQFLVPVLENIPENSWIAINDLQNATRTEQYSWAIFKATSHMLSIGFGRFPPQNVTDVWLTMASMIIGATFYALFIGNVSTLLLSTDSSGRLYDEKLNQIDEYMRYRKIPPSIRTSVHKYYDYRYRRKYFDEEAILTSLSKGLRERIISFNYETLIKNTPLFQNSNEAFVTAVLTRLNVEVFLANEIIIESGSKGDRMYFIARGRVRILSDEQKSLSILDEGSYFGEICLLTDDRRTATAKAITACDLCTLTKTDFEKIIEEFPDVRQVFAKKALARLSKLQVYEYVPEGLSQRRNTVISTSSCRTYRKSTVS